MGKTLEELDVKVGDILQWDDTDYTVTVTKIEDGRVYMNYSKGEVDYPLEGVPKWNLVECPSKWIPWGEMPAEDRVKILYGFYVDKQEVEWSYNGDERDSDSVESTPLWSPGVCYRLKGEPVVEQVELFGGKHTDYGYIWEDDEGCSKYWYNYKLTFKTVDGEIDCNTVKMEEI